ncbi:hypothetical protein DID80_01675 [Candidatus Marinamargulisbacteria bacterium SCGC AAA071-K20]|nr:hypothetical protein DID80_01675 [Candidatus Marinamargulisbacteria bacterium SCGC AAA071-K20]
MFSNFISFKLISVIQENLALQVQSVPKEKDLNDPPQAHPADTGETKAGSLDVEIGLDVTELPPIDPNRPPGKCGGKQLSRQFFLPEMNEWA